MRFLTIWNDIVNLLFPRQCAMCGERLSTQEEFLCVNCLRKLPYTNSHLLPENPIEKLYWYHIPIERVASYLYYSSEKTKRIFYDMKYYSSPMIGVYMGRMMARDMMAAGVFDGVEVIVPVPLAWRKRLSRGYNQCDYLSRGIREVTGLPIERKAVKRTVNNPTQTRLTHEERRENVKDIFTLVHPERLRGKHILIVDDVITTGETSLSFAREIMKAGDVKFSVVSLGYAGEPFFVALQINEKTEDDDKILC